MRFARSKILLLDIDALSHIMHLSMLSLREGGRAGRGWRFDISPKKMFKIHSLGTAPLVNNIKIPHPRASLTDQITCHTLSVVKTQHI